MGIVETRLREAREEVMSARATQEAWLEAEEAWRAAAIARKAARAARKALKVAG